MPILTQAKGINCQPDYCISESHLINPTKTPQIWSISHTYNRCWELLSWALSLIIISPSVSSSLDRGPGPPKPPEWPPRWRSRRDLLYDRPLWPPLPLRLRNGAVLSSCSEKVNGMQPLHHIKLGEITNDLNNI